MKWKPTVPAAVSAIRATRTILSGRNFCTAAPARLDSRAFQAVKKKTIADARGLKIDLRESAQYAARAIDGVMAAGISRPARDFIQLRAAPGCGCVRNQSKWPCR